MANLFAGARDRARGVSFTLPDTGIEGVAFGLAPSVIRGLMKQFSGSNFLKMIAAQEWEKLIEPGTESLAFVITVCTRQDAEAVSDILELPLRDQKELTIACMRATFGEEGPEDFFADWTERAGLAGTFDRLKDVDPASLKNVTPANETGGETSSQQGQELTPEQEAALLDGEELPPQ